MAIVVAAILVVAVVALIGWNGRGDDAPTPSPPQPTATSPPTSAIPRLTATPTVVPTSTPFPSAILPPVATPARPDPGPATLAFGTDVQDGRHGYTFWCAGDAAGKCVMSERYGGPVPLETLPVAPGGTLAFTYRGLEPLTAIASLAYALAGAGSGEYPTLRGGAPLPTVQTERQAAITAPAAPGEYVVIVRISGPKNTMADFQFHILVM